MTHPDSNQRLARLMRLLAERLEGYLDGDDLAFETLGEALEDEGFAPEDLQAAAWMLRGLIDHDGDPAALAAPPGTHAHRVLSAEERNALTPDAWGYLLDLKRRGSLDEAQIERVLDLLAESDVRPVDVETARETATRVALQGNPADERPHGEIDVIH